VSSPCDSGLINLQLPAYHGLPPSYSTLTFEGLNSTAFSHLRIQTFILHPFIKDIVISLVSPNGTSIEISNGLGDNDANVFNGTIWDDLASIGAGNATTKYATGFVSPVLRPQESLSTLLHDPNGNWTLVISNVGILYPYGLLSRWIIYLDRAWL